MRHVMNYQRADYPNGFTASIVHYSGGSFEVGVMDTLTGNLVYHTDAARWDAVIPCHGWDDVDAACRAISELDVPRRARLFEFDAD